MIISRGDADTASYSIYHHAGAIVQAPSSLSPIRTTRVQTSLQRQIYHLGMFGAYFCKFDISDVYLNPSFATSEIL